MPAPTDRNARIALLKGWTWTGELLPLPNQCNYYSEWRDPMGRVDFRPNFVGTLEGVSGMLWELGPEWTLHPHPPNGWLIWRDDGLVGGICEVFYSPRQKLGDCVGDAYLSMFEEAINA